MTIHIGMLLYPGLTQLDLTGPFEVLHRVPNAQVHLLWKTLDAIASDSTLRILPTATLAACPKLDVVFVPGGSGQTPIVRDADVLAFLAKHGAGARFVAELSSETVAKSIQLGLEYDPAPPFRAGHPDVAEPEIVEAARGRMEPLVAQRRNALTGVKA
jgi:hypothetical protein